MCSLRVTWEFRGGGEYQVWLHSSPEFPEVRMLAGVIPQAAPKKKDRR